MHRALLTFAMLFFATSASGMEIEWRVEHPYRYYRHQSDLDMHRWALRELRAELPEAAEFAPISHMERKLNKPTWWDAQKLSEIAKQRSIEGKQPETPTPEMIRHGWASFLRSSPQGYVDGTCWNPTRQNHSRCDESEKLGTTGARTNYLKPKFHRIVLTVKDAGTDLVNSPCKWEAEADVLLRTGSNAERRSADPEDCTTPIIARIPYVGNDSSPIRIWVTLQNGDSASALVHVKDFLIFGLGDSFSSGEGNPEVPAKLHNVRAIGPAEPRAADLAEVDGKNTFFGVPRRSSDKGGSAAKWTDRRCHRSAYSYQNRVALQLAISPDPDNNHHHAVTFFHFACSGAEVTEDILYAWEGRECSSAAQRLHRRGRTSGKGPRHRYYMPQISRASVALCGEKRPQSLSWLTRITGKIDGKIGLQRQDHYVRQRQQYRRKPANHCDFRRDNFTTNPRLLYCSSANRIRNIDLLLSTAGGNDVGFSGIIANTIVTASGVSLIRPFYPDRFVSEASARQRLEFLPHRLKVYDRALETFLGIKKNSDNKKPVIAMLYPNLVYRNGDMRNGDRFCQTDNTGMDVSQYLGIKSRAALMEVERLVEGERVPGNDSTYDGMVKIIGDSAENMGWAAVDGHRRAFMDHGICTSDKTASPNESTKGTAEETGIPYKRVDLGKSGIGAQYSDNWRGFDPVNDLYPYESRKAWFRTPNQDFMNIHYYKGDMPDAWKLDGKRVSATFLANRILGGSFHPTAEGHSHIADHVYCQAREKLFGQICVPSKVNEHAYKWKKPPDN
jgi:hypothetical protein